MEKKELLLLLKKKLLARGIDPAHLERQMGKIEMLLDAEADPGGEEGEAFDYLDEEGIETLTDELFALMTRFRKKPPAADDNTSGKTESANENSWNAESEELIREYKAAAGLTRETSKVRDVVRTRDVPAGETTVFVKVTSGEETNEPRGNGGDTQVIDAVYPTEADSPRRPSADEEAPPRRADILEVSFTDGGEAQDYPLQESESAAEDSAGVKPRGTLLFWVLFGFSAPFLLILAALGAAGFAGGFFAMALLIGTLFASLIAVVAAGTAAALVEIIYGITQLFKYAPIGLCEMGIGIMIAGAAMLSGILMYNAAVRLLPFLMKKFAVLLRLTLKNTRRLYYFLKGECAKL